jgi:hypothetical protein
MIDLIKRLFSDHQRMYPHHAHLCAECKDSVRILVEAGCGNELPDYLLALAPALEKQA